MSLLIFLLETLIKITMEMNKIYIYKEKIYEILLYELYWQTIGYYQPDDYFISREDKIAYSIAYLPVKK